MLTHKNTCQTNNLQLNYHVMSVHRQHTNNLFSLEKCIQLHLSVRGTGAFLFDFTLLFRATGSIYEFHVLVLIFKVLILIQLLPLAWLWSVQFLHYVLPCTSRHIAAAELLVQLFFMGKLLHLLETQKHTKYFDRTNTF